MPTSLKKPLLLLLCLQILMLRIVGAHFHLCFDGQEPPVSVHMMDGGTEHLSGEHSLPHQDANLDAGSATVTKSSVLEFDFPTVLLVMLALWIAVSYLLVPRISRTPNGLLQTLSELLPPLRGPPRTNLA